MSDIFAKLESWIARQGVRSRVPASRIMLGHVNGDGSVTAISSFAIGALDEVARGEIVAELGKVAAEHAELLPGPQTYQAALCWPRAGSDQLDAHATHLFRLQGATMGGPLSPTEPANEKGVLAQTMRHSEARERLNVMALQNVLVHMTKQAERDQERIERLEKERVQSFELLKDLITETHERQLEITKADRSERRKDSALQAVNMLLPTVGMGIAKKLGAGVEIPRNLATEAIAHLLKSLSREQVVRFMSSLEPAQQAAFMAAYRDLALRGEAEADAVSSEPSKEGGQQS